MKDKNFLYNVETDVNSIEINVTNATVEICEATDEKFCMEYPNTKNIFAGSNENGIIIHQGKCGFFIKPHQGIKIFAPAHTVPSLKIYGKSVDLIIKNGIYGELNLSAEDGNVSLSGCVLESGEILGGDINLHVCDATVKNDLVLQTDKGEALLENTFLTRAEVRVKRGNIGIVNVSCKDCAFDTQKGNITASLKGNEDEFNTSIVTREGTSNRESSAMLGADGNFHAYTKKGNIVLDFVGEKQVTPPDTTENEVLTEGISEEEKEKENA